VGQQSSFGEEYGFSLQTAKTTSQYTAHKQLPKDIFCSFWLSVEFPGIWMLWNQDNNVLRGQNTTNDSFQSSGLHKQVKSGGRSTAKRWPAAMLWPFELLPLGCLMGLTQVSRE